MSQDSEKILTLALELIPNAKDLINQGRFNIPLDNLVIDLKGKSPMEVQKDLDLNSQSMHATRMLTSLGQVMCSKLQDDYPDKKISCFSIWGRAPSLAISNKK